MTLPVMNEIRNKVYLLEYKKTILIAKIRVLFRSVVTVLLSTKDINFECAAAF